MCKKSTLKPSNATLHALQTMCRLCAICIPLKETLLCGCRMSPSTSASKKSEATKATLRDRSATARSAARRPHRSSIMYEKTSTNATGRCPWLIFYAGRRSLILHHALTMRCLRPTASPVPRHHQRLSVAPVKTSVHTNRSDISRIISG